MLREVEKEEKSEKKKDKEKKEKKAQPKDFQHFLLTLLLALWRKESVFVLAYYYCIWLPPAYYPPLAMTILIIVGEDKKEKKEKTKSKGEDEVCGCLWWISVQTLSPVFWIFLLKGVV